MSEHPMSESGQRELQAYLDDERRKILDRAYRHHYADKNPHPLDSESIANAIAEVNTDVANQVSSPSQIVTYRAGRVQRFVVIILLYQLMGILLFGTGIAFATYRAALLYLPESRFSYLQDSSISLGVAIAYVGFVLYFTTKYLGQLWLQMRQIRDHRTTVAKDDRITRIDVGLPDIDEREPSRFIWEWQSLERKLREIYAARFGDDSTGLRDIIRSVEDIGGISNYQANQVLRALQVRNRLLHGDGVETIPRAELSSITEEVREIKRQIDQFDTEGTGHQESGESS